LMLKSTLTWRRLKIKQTVMYSSFCEGTNIDFSYFFVTFDVSGWREEQDGVAVVVRHVHFSTELSEGPSSCHGTVCFSEHPAILGRCGAASGAKGEVGQELQCIFATLGTHDPHP